MAEFENKIDSLATTMRKAADNQGRPEIRMSIIPKGLFQVFDSFYYSTKMYPHVVPVCATYYDGPDGHKPDIKIGYVHATVSNIEKGEPGRVLALAYQLENMASDERQYGAVSPLGAMHTTIRPANETDAAATQEGGLVIETLQDDAAFLMIKRNIGWSALAGMTK